MDASQITITRKPIIFFHNEPISSIVSRLGKNFEVDILGRFLWYTDKLQISPDCKKRIELILAERRKKGLPEETVVRIQNLSKDEATSCVYTHHAVMTLFFGKSFKDSMALNKLDSDPATAINEMKQIIIEKESSANILYRLYYAANGYGKAAEIPLDEHHWTVFSLKIPLKVKDKNYTAHACVVLQAYENRTLKYKILQSFINQYQFNKYDVSYSTSEIFLMLDELLNYVNATHWNPVNMHLFNHFFKARDKFPCWKEMKVSRSLKIEWGEVNRESIEYHARQFNAAFPDHYVIQAEK